MAQFTYELDEDRGKVRLLIPDNDAENFAFEDKAIDAFLTLQGGDVFRAAALGLETIATSEALIQKVQRTIDIDTDGAKLADALLKRAGLLREQADAGEDGGGDFEIVEFAGDEFSRRDLVWNELLREA